MKIVDLSHTITEGMPVFPGTLEPAFKPANTFAEHGFWETELNIASHTGTHIDSPAHMIKGAKTLDQFDIDKFFGLALIIDFPPCAGNKIALEHLQSMEHKISLAEFVIFHTRHYQKWGTEQYFHGYTILTEEAASWLTSFPLKGVGVDAISIDAMDSTVLHKIFLSKEILIIENLTNLSAVKNELCMFSILPLKIKNIEGSPVRAVAIETGTYLPLSENK